MLVGLMDILSFYGNASFLDKHHLFAIQWPLFIFSTITFFNRKNVCIHVAIEVEKKSEKVIRIGHEHIKTQSTKTSPLLFEQYRTCKIKNSIHFSMS